MAAVSRRPTRASLDSRGGLFGALVALLTLAAPAVGANDLSHLGDEFNNPFTLPLWQRVHVVEGWNAEQLETIDISAFRLDILDAAGRLVRRVAAGVGNGAEVSRRWDGQDSAGRPAAAGVYFARLEAGGASRVARLIRVP